MGDWIAFEADQPDPMALVAYYIPGGNYAWGTGANYDAIKKEYPSVSHWKVITLPPPA